jgi:3-oxoacyl-[acyl-carrier protein] reductase
MEQSRRVALVTGAARGIGLGIAQALSSQGRHVVLVDANPDVHAAAARIPAAEALLLDITDEAAIESAIEGVASRCGGIDILVNNAGISGRRGAKETPVAELAAADWERVIATNLTGSFLMCKACVPVMRRRKWGRIVNMASQAARARSDAMNAHYASSKAALIGFSRSLALEVAGDGITVNCVAPGRIRTEMTASHGEAADRVYEARSAVHRVGEPRDIAAAVAFFVSDQASYITGATLDVNGGASMN